MKMGKSKGSVSLLLLLAALVLALIAHLGLLWSTKQLDRTRHVMLTRQLRNLNGSFLRVFSGQRPPKGQWTCYEGTLQPAGETVKVTVTSTYSSDNLINFLKFKAAAGGDAEAAQQLCQLHIIFSEAQQNLAGRYALASRKTKGLEYLAEQSLYIQANNEEVRLPQIGFLSGKALSGLTIDGTETDGLHARFYYLPAYDDITLSSNTTMLGSSVLSKYGRFTIGENCHFPHRVALMSEQGSITIKQNTRLDKALIMAYSQVVIESGCRINGLIIANEIVLLGPSEFTADADVVAPFASAVFTDA